MENKGLIIRERNGVRYKVGNWEKFVPFGRDKEHQAGGPAFRSAAQEFNQRLEALNYANPRRQRTMRTNKGIGIPLGMLIGGIFSAIVGINAHAMSDNPLIYIGVPAGIFSIFFYVSWRVDVKQTWKPKWWWDK